MLYTKRSYGVKSLQAIKRLGRDLRPSAPPGQITILRAMRDQNGEYVRDRNGNVLPENESWTNS